MADQITEACERLFEFHVPDPDAHEREFAKYSHDYYAGHNRVREIYSAGNTEFAKYCRRPDMFDEPSMDEWDHAIEMGGIVLQALMRRVRGRFIR